MSRLRELREELKISREKLVILTGGKVCASTLRNAETGKHRMTHDKAESLLAAVNMLLTQQQQAEVTLKDLELRLY